MKSFIHYSKEELEEYLTNLAGELEGKSSSMERKASIIDKTEDKIRVAKANLNQEVEDYKTYMAEYENAKAIYKLRFDKQNTF